MHYLPASFYFLLLAQLYTQLSKKLNNNIMNNKTLAVVAYITLIGWLIAYFSGKEKADDFLRYHLRQGLGIFVFGIFLSIILNILMMLTGIYSLGYIGLINIVLMIIGAINASNGVMKPLPIIGTFFENKFKFIS